MEVPRESVCLSETKLVTTGEVAAHRRQKLIGHKFLAGKNFAQQPLTPEELKKTRVDESHLRHSLNLAFSRGNFQENLFQTPTRSGFVSFCIQHPILCGSMQIDADCTRFDANCPAP